MLRVHLRLTAPRRRGKAGRPLVEYESWIVAGKKVNMLRTYFGLKFEAAAVTA